MKGRFTMNLIDEQRAKIAYCLECLRNAYGLTRSEVSRATKIPVKSLYSYETKGKLSDDRLNQLADFYDVPPAAILLGWNSAQKFVPRP